MPLSDKQINQTATRFRSFPNCMVMKFDAIGFAREIERLATEAERERCKAMLGKAATMARDAASNVEKGNRHIGQSYKQHMNDCADLINKIAEELFPKEADNG